MQFFVITILDEQTLMGATLDNLPLVEHTDLIGILDSRQTVGDGYGGARLHQSLQGILYQSLTLCVEG